jgi:hypothetical protein
MRPTTPSIADFTLVEHVLPLLLGGAAPAESLQMAFAASELAIADVKPSLDLSRLRAAK